MACASGRCIIREMAAPSMVAARLERAVAFAGAGSTTRVILVGCFCLVRMCVVPAIAGGKSTARAMVAAVVSLTKEEASAAGKESITKVMGVMGRRQLFSDVVCASGCGKFSTDVMTSGFLLAPVGALVVQV